MIRDLSATKVDKSGYWVGRSLGFWKTHAEETFKEVTKLAATSQRGCVQARKAIKKADKHGLSDRAYVVRDGILCGWTGVQDAFKVEPLWSGAARGGTRRGAGRKPADKATGLKRVNITIDDQSKMAYKKYGDGDVSLGIRKAAKDFLAGGKTAGKWYFTYHIDNIHN